MAEEENINPPPVEEEMQESLMHQEPQSSEAPLPEQGYQNVGYEYPQEGQYQQAYPQQYGYEQQYAGPSADSITEISEQVVSEKLSQIKNDLVKAIEFKNTAETKINFLDQRLNRIEAIIDKLQLAILQKVGSYVTNVEDLKKEVIETQKSFKSLLDKKGIKQQTQ